MEDNSRINEMASMIRGIALKASKQLFDRSVDDIEQDLWVKVLETEKRKGHPIDLKLAGRVCWDYVKDMIDYDIRRSHTTIDLSGTGEESTDYIEAGSSDFLGVVHDKGDRESEIMLNDLYKKFPDPKSKERIFLDFWGNASGAHPNNNPNALPSENRSSDGYSEKQLARLLGYSDQASGGYKTFRRKMKELISDYYELKD